ncbi:MAG: dimethyl sulfoxide reductase anchor subunit [Rhodobacteraceae bacterium]|nr:dimethyl sulfoxide reductase anchor subunit [Paracoccaceae bacterium]
MHPAPSVIIFSTISGLGFGLMLFLGLGLPDVSGWVAATFATLALGLATIGLLASTFHLGKPKNAIYAFSQWKTSWLSREGILAVLTLVVFFIYAALWAFMDNRIAMLGYLAAALAMGTVFTTSMIYAQLKTVPRWNTAVTPLLFLLYASAGGALLSNQMTVALVLLGLIIAFQAMAWFQGDTAFARSGSSIETATGLGNLGKVRLLEKPHSGKNYLLQEMVYVVGRKHAAKLRVLSLVLVALLPALLILLTEVNHVVAIVILLSHIVGLFAQRWLFFAQAEHVVGLYYDAR